MIKIKRILVGLITVVIAVLLFTSQTVPNNVNGFTADAGSFEILNSYQGRRNVLKVDKAKTDWNIISYSLGQYRGKEIFIEFSADVRREGTAGDLMWQVNISNYPIIARIANAASGQWYSMQGKMILTPEQYTVLNLTNWEMPSNTTVYIANPVITITEGNPLSPDLSLKPLKDIYANNFFIGNISDYKGKYLSGRYFDLLKHHYNSLTINCVYPEQLAPLNKGGAYRFTEADNIVNIARRNNFSLFGHVLVWHEVTPAWFFEGTRDEVIQYMTNHINTVLRHFKGRITAWDVVNEAMKHTVTASQARGDWKTNVRRGDQWTPNSWYEKLGSDYIELAFRAARAADPDITLYYNDYGIENPNKAEAVRKMILDINNRYKRETGGSRNLIEGIGIQFHVSNIPQLNVWGTALTMNNIRSSLDKFVSLGIEIAISELDITRDTSAAHQLGEGNDSEMLEKDSIAQAVLYAQLFNLFKEYSSNITRVTFWGIDDGTSWLSADNPTLFDWRLNAKHSFHAVSDPDGFIKKHGGRARR